MKALAQALGGVGLVVLALPFLIGGAWMLIGQIQTLLSGSGTLRDISVYAGFALGGFLIYVGAQALALIHARRAFNAKQ